MGPGGAAQGPIGPSLVVSTEDQQTTFTPTRRPIAVASGAGTTIAAWTAIDPVQGDRDIYFARSTDGGVTWTEPGTLNTNAATDGGNRQDVSPTLATDGAGKWVAVWIGPRASYGPPFAGSDPVVSMSIDDGATWSPGALLQPAPTGGPDAVPVVAWLGATTWGAAWSSVVPNGGQYDVLFSRSTDGGATWSASTVLNGAAGDAATDLLPTIATDLAGTVLVGWSSSNSSTGVLEADVRVVRSTDFGGTWSPPSFVVPPDPMTRRDRGLALAHVAPFGWAGVWIADGAFGSISSTPMIVAALSADGLAWTRPATLQESAATDGVADAALAASGDGRLTAVWSATRAAAGGTSGPDFDILASESADGGASWNEPRAVNPGAVGDAADNRLPSVAMTETGWVASWSVQMNVGGPDGSSVAMRGFGPAGPCPFAPEGADCDGDLVDDDCAVALAWLPDCNANDAPDGCDIFSGLEDDCDADGVPDACAILMGIAEDCDANGVPDQCQLADYRHGAGPTEQSIGVSTGTWDVLVLERYRVRAGAEVMTGVNVSWQFEFTALPETATLGLWSDPDGDGSPLDATLLFSMPFVPDAAFPGAVQSVPTPATPLGTPGDGVFVGVLLVPQQLVGAVHVDPACVGGTSWIGVSPVGSADPVAIGSTMSIRPFGYWFETVGNWGISIEAQSSFDVDGDGVLDACVSAADLDGDGVVGSADAGILLASWGPCSSPCPADLDGDGVVDGTDLGILLSEWG